MLLDGVAAAQRLGAKARPRLVERASRRPAPGASSNRPSCAAGVSSVRTTPSSRSFAPGFTVSQRLSSSAATALTVRPSQVGGATARWRVKVVKSPRRIFTPTQPVTSARARSRVQARSASRASSRCSACGSPMSCSKVSSALRDLSSVSGCTGPFVDAGGALAHPGAVAAEQRPQHRIGRAAQLPEGGDARGLHLGAGLAPRPGMRRTGSGSSTARTRSALTTVRPSGLARSEAILATSLLGATPTEAVRPVSSRMRALMWRAICTASPSSCWLAVTSRKASSSDRPCTSGVTSWKTPKTCSETSW